MAVSKPALLFVEGHLWKATTDDAILLHYLVPCCKAHLGLEPKAANVLALHFMQQKTRKEVSRLIESIAHLRR